MTKQLTFLFIFFGAASCGSGNMFDCDNPGPLSSQCEEKTPDEKAMLAFNSGDLETARVLLEELIAAEPSEYFRYPRLAAIYAELGGLDLLNVGQIQGQGSGSFVDKIGEFLPTPKTSSKEEYEEYLDSMKQAKELLTAIPEDERVRSEEIFYSASAEFQLTLYQAAYSVMFMNKFASSPANLQEMTPTDALIILGNLRDAAANAEGNAPEIAAKIDEVLTQISAQDGANDEEKLEKFLQSRGVDTSEQKAQ